MAAKTVLNKLLRNKKRLLTLSGAMALVVALTLAFILRAQGPPVPCAFTVRSGEALSSIATRLEQQKIIGSAAVFKTLAQLQGASRRLKAGTYHFDGALSPGDVLAKLTSGKVELRRCTIAEGLSVAQVITRCVAAGMGTRADFVKLARQREFLASLHIAAPTLEGYLFPETYTFAPGCGARVVFTAMVRQMRRHLDGKLLAAAKSHGLNEYQLLTLASIIQKEAGNEAEMPLISAVFHNRLRRGMLLQADPTVIYGIANFNGNLTRRDLTTDTPYNTYTRRGLPPGPIANPGLAALRAAANPADKPYLYFVATGTGGHYFSRSLREHNRAVRRYQLHRR